jgi:hypothetical protein
MSVMRIPIAPVLLQSPHITLATSGLRAAGHPELWIEVREDLVPPQQVHWLADALGGPILDAQARFEPGDALRMGWSTLRFRGEDDHVRVDEWDFANGAFIPGVTQALLAIGAMNELLERTGLLDASRYPHGEELAAWAVGRDTSAVTACREAAEAPDSGWRFAAEGPTAAEMLPLWAIVGRLPALLPVLALPPGSFVDVRDGAIVEVAGPTA